MTVDELRTLLATWPGDVETGVLHLSQTGIGITIEAAPLVTLDATLDDHGRPSCLWFLGVGDPPGPTPAIITWPCPCGALISLADHDEWPAEHDTHLYGQR